ncbi:hypothetical protein BBJ28_00004908 [Nothophytophthora sp. Chile5]|nr:hypothetical protein BBJ28_00004908 [Nothophytophthora sp. Chile5]
MSGNILSVIGKKAFPTASIMADAATVVDLVDTRSPTPSSPAADHEDVMDVVDVVDVTTEGPDDQEAEQQEEKASSQDDDEIEVMSSVEGSQDPPTRTDQTEHEEGNDGEEVVVVDSAQDSEDRESDQKQQSGEDSGEEEEVEFVGSLEGTTGHQEASASGQQELDDSTDVVILENSDGPQEHQPPERSRANTNALMAANGHVTAATLEAEFQCIICQYAMFKIVGVFSRVCYCLAPFDSRVCLMDSFLSRSIEEAQCPTCRVEILQPLAATSTPSAIFNVNLLIPSVATRIPSYQDEEEAEYTHKLDQLEAKWKIFFLSERAVQYHGDHDEDQHVSSPRWEEGQSEGTDYPVLKVEDSQDGNLQVSRNVVLDTNDANEDGYHNMRVGLAVMEFPSVFELYNEHQECSITVVKMEEDEEIADGLPFFMDESGDDDVLVCSSYYNEITLRVWDDAVRSCLGNCVMERTRGAQAGTVTFPGLRLDVPGGTYTFRFSDDLYGLKLSITTRLRELHETTDSSIAEYVSLINDEARDARRRNRGGNPRESDEEDEEDGNESDDSFIVNDLEVEAPVGRFSDDEEEFEAFDSDDEQADEDQERRRRARRRRRRRRPEAGRDVETVEEYLDTTRDAPTGGEPQHPVFSTDDEAGQEDDNAEDVGEEEEHQEVQHVARPRRRNANHILDSEDEAEDVEVKADGDDEHGEQEGHENTGEDEPNGDASGEDEVEERESQSNGEVPSRKVKRDEWEQAEDSDVDEEMTVQPSTGVSSDEEHEEEARPVKRARVLSMEENEDESAGEEEQEEAMEPANSTSGTIRFDNVSDEDLEETHEDDAGFQHMSESFDEEEEERHSGDEAQQEGDVHDDYPDEEEDDAGDEDEEGFQEEEGDYDAEFSE